MTDLEQAAAAALDQLGPSARVSIEQQAHVVATRRTRLEDGTELIEYDMGFAQVCLIGFSAGHEFRVVAQGST